MIESFGIHHNDVAKWAGILSAVFSVSQCLTGIPWGQASDKYGRKPIILLAMTCAMASSMLFGFSTSLRWAIISRALSGASNGNVGILRTTVAEMVPQRVLQPKAFAVLPLVWSLGSILGPIIGGALASPATKLPGLFGRNQFFKKFPFALPNLVNGIIFTFGLLVGILFLKESLEARKYRRDYGRMAGKWLTRSCTGRRKDLRPADDFESMLPSDKSRNGKSTSSSTYAELFHYQTNLTLLSYTILALHGIAYDQLLPVMMHLPAKRGHVDLPLKFSGGFGLESGRIGLLFTIYGGIGMLVSLCP
jgi:MFS family permease